MSRSAHRRLEEKKQRRELIVDAAERIFSQSSFDSVSMEDVAREARISRALLYVYFQDKSDLYFAICLRALQLLKSRFETAARKQENGFARVQAIGLDYIAFAGRYPVYFAALSRFEAHARHSVGGRSGGALGR